MKIIYTKPIEIQLQTAIDSAYLQGKKIEKIELTKTEMDEFKAYLRRITRPSLGRYAYVYNELADLGIASFMGVSIVEAK